MYPSWSMACGRLSERLLRCLALFIFMIQVTVFSCYSDCFCLIRVHAFGERIALESSWDCETATVNPRNEVKFWISILPPLLSLRQMFNLQGPLQEHGATRISDQTISVPLIHSYKLTSRWSCDFLRLDWYFNNAKFRDFYILRNHLNISLIKCHFRILFI